MNNTDINLILEAAGELDNYVLENAFGRRKKKPIALIAIASAAALSLLVGFTVIYSNNVVVNGKPVFEYNIKIHDEVTPPSAEELMEIGVSDIYSNSANCYEYAAKDIDPRDIIRKYNITPLANDNFSRADIHGYSTSDRDAEEYRELFLSKTRVQVAEDYHENGMYGSYVRFIYWLADDNLDIPVNFRVLCLTGNYNASMTQNFSSVKPDGSDIVCIDLNNNEKCLINQSRYDNGEILSVATFTYDGMIYDIHADTDIEGMKRILSDLGVVAE
ncbi:MAG: hypothetical protein J1F28_09290 [Oscillospiraceae bacterium]|nr:hypothetical protein [Oscillospiraceae bacterium]